MGRANKLDKSGNYSGVVYLSFPGANICHSPVYPGNPEVLLVLDCPVKPDNDNNKR
ncbi:MAG: hypothetical protein ABH914_00805 [Candidatus Omnitrophota bacterium]